MNLTCVPANYFDSPDFLTLALHLITVFSFPIHSFGMYCILMKTPEQMKSVKWHMLQFHCWTVVLDVLLSFLGIPFILVPAVAVFPVGILRYFNIPILYQSLLFVAVFGCKFGYIN